MGKYSIIISNEIKNKNRTLFINKHSINKARKLKFNTF